MTNTILKLSFVAVFALVLGVATNTKAATVGTDYDSVGFTYLKKGGFSGMLKVYNSSEQTEINAFEALFDTDDIVVWDKVEVDNDSDYGYHHNNYWNNWGHSSSQLGENGLISLDLDHGNKSGSWSIDENATDFDAGNIVGFAVKAGKYTGYFKFDDAGLAIDTIVAFSSLADYAEDLFGDMHGYKDKFFDKAVSHLTVFGSTSLGGVTNPVTAVPVPPSVAMMGLSLLGFGFLSWRRKKYLGR